MWHIHIWVRIHGKHCFVGQPHGRGLHAAKDYRSGEMPAMLPMLDR